MIVKRWVRGLAGAMVAVGVMAGCDVPPPPEAAPGPTPGPARTPARTPSATQPTAGERCPEGGVRLREGAGDAAMGLRIADIQLVNCGAQPYVLEGYPEVRMLDKEGAPVEVAIGPGSRGITSAVPSVDDPPRKVVLEPGQAASVALLWRNLVTDSTVSAVEGWELEITPRAGAPRLSLRLTHPVDLGNTGKLGTGAWTDSGAR